MFHVKIFRMYIALLALLPIYRKIQRGATYPHSALRDIIFNPTNSARRVQLVIITINWCVVQTFNSLHSLLSRTRPNRGGFSADDEALAVSMISAFARANCSILDVNQRSRGS